MKKILTSIIKNFNFVPLCLCASVSFLRQLIISLFFFVPLCLCAFVPFLYADWEISLKVSGNKIGGNVIFGVKEGAGDGFDQGIDLPVITSEFLGEYILPYIYQTEGGSNRYLSRDISSAVYPKEWVLEITSNLEEGTPITLMWGHLPDAADILSITDSAVNEVIDMRSTGRYSYTNTDISPRRFLIKVDKKDGGQIDLDKDKDGMPDDWELTNSIDDPAADPDSDGLINLDEYKNGTNPNKSDTDRDGVSDGEEVIKGMNPNDPRDNQPVADAGLDQTVDPSFVTIDGGLSKDPNGDRLTYYWTEDEKNPVQVYLRGGADRQQFILTKRGVYRYILKVWDGKVFSEGDEIAVTVNNLPPTAEAGVDITIEKGDTAILDGSRSVDPNDDLLVYKWRQMSGALVSINGTGSDIVSFIPQDSGVYIFGLTVNDGIKDSLEDEAVVTVNNPNFVPTADAGEDIIADAGSVITLDGSRSIDPDNQPQPLRYTWKIEGAPEAVVLSDSNISKPTFKPAASGIYRFSLTVNDGKDTSISDEVNITVNNFNKVPAADAGGDKLVKTLELVELGGGKSYDEDNSPSPLRYKWEQTGGGKVSLTDADKMTASFTPVNPDLLTFSLTVDDGKNTSLPDFVSVTVERDNRAPVADAGADKTGKVLEKIVLNGSGSRDPDGDGLSYIWAQTFGAKVVLDGYDTVSPVFSAQVPGIYKFSLIVDDGELLSLPDEVILEAEGKNHIPAAKISGRSIAKIGEEVILDGGKSYDVDNDALSYKWRQSYGKIVDIKGDTAETAKIVFTKEGLYRFELLVSDGQAFSKPARIAVFVIKNNGFIYTVNSSKDNKITDKTTDSAVEIFVPKSAVEGEMSVGVTTGKDRLSALPDGVTAVSDAVKIVPLDIRLKGEMRVTIMKEGRGGQRDKGTKAAVNTDLSSKRAADANNEGGLRVYKYNEETAGWYEYGDAVQADNGVSFSTAEFGEYAAGRSVSAAPAAADPESVPAGDAPVSTPPKEESLSLKSDSGSGNGCFINNVIE